MCLSELLARILTTPDCEVYAWKSCLKENFHVRFWMVGGERNLPADHIGIN